MCLAVFITQLLCNFLIITEDLISKIFLTSNDIVQFNFGIDNQYVLVFIIFSYFGVCGLRQNIVTNLYVNWRLIMSTTNALTLLKTLIYFD